MRRHLVLSEDCVLSENYNVPCGPRQILAAGGIEPVKQWRNSKFHFSKTSVVSTPTDTLNSIRHYSCMYPSLPSTV